MRLVHRHCRRPGAGDPTNAWVATMIRARWGHAFRMVGRESTKMAIGAECRRNRTRQDSSGRARAELAKIRKRSPAATLSNARRHRASQLPEATSQRSALRKPSSRTANRLGHLTR